MPPNPNGYPTATSRRIPARPGAYGVDIVGPGRIPPAPHPGPVGERDPLAELWSDPAPHEAPRRPSVGARPIGRPVPLDIGDDLPDPEFDELEE